MNDQLRARLNTIQYAALLIGLGGFVALAIGYFTGHERQFFQSYLYAYFIPLGFALGSLGLTMINYLTGGFWGLGARRVFQAGIRTLPLMAILFLPIAYTFVTQPHGALEGGHGEGHGHGVYWLYPWTDGELVHHDKILTHKAGWLDGQFVLARAVGYFVVWMILGFWILSKAKKYDETGDEKADAMTRLISGPGFLIFFLTMTFAAFDWAMSLEPHWFSTMYGVIFIVGQGLSTLAFSILFLSWIRKFEPIKNVAKPNLFADLATLLFASVMLWTYTSFSQFLIIWSGNTSEESPWYMLRTNNGWQLVGISLLVLHFAVPFFLLLHRRIKRDASLVPFVAVLLIVMRFVDVYWQVAPPFHTEFHPTWMDFVAPVALVGIWLAFFVSRFKAHPLTSARQELAVEAALGGHAHH